MKKKNLFVSLGLQTLLIIFVLMSVQLVAVSFFVRKSLFKSSKSNYQEFARLYSEDVSAELEKTKAKMDFYVKAPVCRTKDSSQIISYIIDNASVRESEFDYVAFVDRQGNFNSDIKTYAFVKDRDYFQGIINEGRDSYIDNPVLSKVSGKHVIHICRAVKVGNETIGFFSGNTTPEKISTIIENIFVGKSGCSALVSGTGEMIATSGEKNFIQSILSSEQGKALALSRDDSGYGIVRTEKGEYSLFYSHINGTEWKNFLVVPSSQIFDLLDVVVVILFISNIVIGVLLISSVCASIYRKTKPLVLIEASINEIASGSADLSKRIVMKNKSDDEIGRVVDGFNGFMEKLQNIIKVIKSLKDELLKVGSDLDAGTQDTASSISQIVSNIQNVEGCINSNSECVEQTSGVLDNVTCGIDSLNSMIESQSASVAEASAAVEQMIGNINSVNVSVGKMADSFDILGRKALEGVEKQENVNSRILVISDESQSLQEANSVISGIAEQTNLLAMNAAIEAAHAGEAGKGFSVVADEIRKLSEISSEQSRTIGEQLQKITADINEIVTVSKTASETFSSVYSEMVQTTSLVAQLRNAMQEQGEGSRQISLALTQMNENTVQVRESSQKMTDGSKEIFSGIKNLQSSTQGMSLGMDEMADGARRIQETGKALSEVSALMAQCIKRLGKEVDLFEV
ncbi:methyl-accepting chemotaxis protein [Treponema sp.]|uniref:methyl-accepting chemotaxis protein n=1 Tax=Treponema sp. TaxID=166 RepID=UPI003EFE43BD